MGLFRRDNPAEKKLKELTGGFLLSTPFINRLKDNGLEIDDGTKIKDQIKQEIKNGSVTEDNIELRLNLLIKQRSTKSVNLKKCPKCNMSQDADNKVCIYCGNRFESDNLQKRCPSCGKSQESDNTFCTNCGYDFSSKPDDENHKECPNCHRKIYIKSKICITCGYNFETEKMPEHVKKCPKCSLIQKGNHITCRNCQENLKEVDFEPADDLIECSKCGRKYPESFPKCSFCGFDPDFEKREQLRKEKENQRKEEEKLKKERARIRKENEEKERIKELERRENKLKLLQFKNRTAFLYNYEFNLKTCPDCNTQLLKQDPFCYNCGGDVLTADTVKNDSLEVKDGKLSVKEESTQSEKLSDLEALYEQTVQSKYAPSFKIAYVLYLEDFRKNPLKKFSDKTAKKYETTPNKLRKQALEDEFIELASPLIAAKDSKVTELKEILKEHDLKVSGKKDELIERLGENLTDDELKKYFKSKNYQVSQSGLEFLEQNRPILYIYSNSDISAAFYPSEVLKIFEEKIYEKEEIMDILTDYLSKTLDEKLTQERWIDFKLYSNALAKVNEDKNSLEDALNIRFKVFLFDINNYSVAMGKPDPKKTKLKKKDMVKLTELLHNMSLPIDELKQEFEKSYSEVLFKTVISKEDSLIFLLKVFGGDDLAEVSKEINESYSNPY